MGVRDPLEHCQSVMTWSAPAVYNYRSSHKEQCSRFAVGEHRRGVPSTTAGRTVVHLRLAPPVRRWQEDRRVATRCWSSCTSAKGNRSLAGKRPTPVVP